MNRITTLVAGMGALAAGAAVVFVVDQQGWLRREAQPSAGAAAPRAIAPARPQSSPAVAALPPQVEVSLASNVKELAAVPRAQRPASATCANNLKVVDLGSGDVVRDAGIVVEPVRETSVTQSIACNAEIVFNGERLAHVTSRAAGVVQKAAAQVGDVVEAGQALVTIDSMDFGAAKAELHQAVELLALREGNMQRLKSIGGNAVTQQEIVDAETNLVEARVDLSRARQHLRNLGLSDDRIEAVQSDPNDSTSLLEVVAPFSGVIIDRHAVLGEAIDVSDALFEIADVSTVWAMLDVRESDARSVRPGLNAVVTLNGLPGETFAGRVAWVASSIDPTTRTLKARVNLDNASGLLRAHMFGRSQVTVADGQRKLVVPKDAVQWDGCCNLVFVRQTDTMFQPFKVRLGADLGTHWVVEDGLISADEIVTRGGFLLKTEIMKDSIGAGCCEAGGIKSGE